MQEKILTLILETAKELGEDEEWAVLSDLDAGAILYGEGGMLDSMGLVSLVIAVEQAIEDRFDRSVSLADEKALSQAKSPYRSAERLAEYAASQLQDE